VAGLVLTAEDGGPLSISALALPLAVAEGRSRVPLFIEIDGATLLENNQEEQARIEVYAYALRPSPAGTGVTGPGTTVAGHLAEAFLVDVPALGEAIWQRGLKFYGQLDLEPGSYRLRVLVRNFHSGATGLRSVALEVPGPPSGASLSPPASIIAVIPGPESRDAWLPVRQGHPFGEPVPPYPFVVRERAVSPATLAVGVAGRPVAGFLFTDRPGELQRTVRGELAPDADGPGGGRSPVGIVDVELGEPLAGPVGALVAVPFRMVVPEVEPGDYSVRLALVDRAGMPAAEAHFPLLLVRGAARERELLWTDVRWLSGEDHARLRSEPTQPPARRRALGERRRSEHLSQGYRQALATLGRGPQELARATLVDLEVGALRLAGVNPLTLLQAAELGVAQGLASGHAESLLPPLVLHEQLYEVYAQRRHYALMAHSRDMVELLADLYARHGGAPNLAGDTLASLGGYQQGANLTASSRRLFQQALELDPNNRAALLGLGVSHERHGERAAALRYFQRLADAHPELAEGRLRLALNLEGHGDRSRARELLAGLLGAGTADWIRALAYQELGRSHLFTGNLERAAALLEEAVSQLEREPSTFALLAHVYDRMGRPRQALEALERAAVAGRLGRNGASARVVYDSWPRAVLEATRNELVVAAERRREALSQLLLDVSIPHGG
jgi:tetratricopeptide (TPR) repeat protein